MPNEPLDNPYAAPQAELRVTAPASRNPPRFQTSILRNALRLTLGVDLIFMFVMILGVVASEYKSKNWVSALEMAGAGILFVNFCCWPIGIACGVLAAYWDYLLQVWGWRKYDAPSEKLDYMVAEYVDTPTQNNPYAKN